MSGHEHPGGVEKLNEMRLLSGLKSIIALLDQHREEKWVRWFQGDLDDFIAAHGPPLQIARQLAVLEHILMAFGGMSNFDRMVLTDESGKPAQQANERLRNLAEQIWLGARGLQAYLVSEAQRD